MRTATILRAQATAIVAEANARATTLNEIADSLESSDGDELLTLEAAGAIVSKSPRAIRESGVEIVKVGRSPRVRRAALMAWARPIVHRDVKPENAPKAEAASAVARAAERWAR